MENNKESDIKHREWIKIAKKEGINMVEAIKKYTKIEKAKEFNKQTEKIIRKAKKLFKKQKNNGK